MQNSKLRIGIVTYWWSNDNYGQLLQCFALQHFLTKLGYEPFLIRYNPKINKNDSTIRTKVLKLIKALNPQRLYKFLLGLYRNRRNEQRNLSYNREFDSFRKDYIICSNNIYSKESIINNPPQADIYITGSDQVWSGTDEIFFLQFGDRKILKCSFAASFGHTSDSISSSKKEKIKNYLSAFDFISVREQDGIDICTSIGRSDALLFPDPTMVITAEVYKSISAPIVVKEKYALIYMIDSSELTPVTMKEIKEYTLRNNFLMKYIASQRRFDSFEKVYPTINQFISYINNAEVIITNSFHGAVFSILLNKEFVVLPKGNSTNGRIITLLNKYNISHRFCNSIAEIEQVFSSEKIEYSTINKTIKEDTFDIISRIQKLFLNKTQK